MPEPDLLQEKIASLQLLLSDAQAKGMKVNEAQTELWIINPLLATLGYGPLEIQKQSHDAHTKQFPDYTILPHEPSRWFLEVKALDAPLGGTEAAQAVGYAVNKGAEWAVLTNGRRWLIYKAHLPKPLPEKLVFEVKDLFADMSAVHTLRLLSRASVMADGLTQAWLASQIGPVIEKELAQAQSATRKALRKAVAAETQSAVMDATITDALKRLMGIGPPPIKEGDLPPLSFWAQNVDLVVGKKPVQIQLGDGPAMPVKSWSVLAQSVVKFVGETYGLPPLPFTGTKTGSKYFINDLNAQATGKPMTTLASVTVAGKVVYLEMNRSADDTILRLAALLQAVDVPLDAVKVQVITQK